MTIIKSSSTIRPTVSLPRNRAEETVQVRVRKNCVVGGKSGGTVFWTTPRYAKIFKDQNAVDIIGDESPVAKPVEPNDAPKSSDAPTPGPTIDSASSIQPGPEAQSSASVEGQVSPESSATTSDAQESEASAESSLSTTPISSALGPTSTTSPTSGGGNGTRRGRTSRRTRE
jgi:hypothetical protein